MRRLRTAIAVLLLSMALTACAIPHPRGDFEVRKVAAGQDEAMDVVARYQSVRKLAIDLSDPKPLSTVEADTVLAIDSGSFDLAVRLAGQQKPGSAGLETFEVAAPMVEKYPLWFTAKVRDRARAVVKLQLFERPAAADGWLLVASPEILQDTVLPSLRRGPGGTIVAVRAGDDSGLTMSPQRAADNYAQALTDARSPASRAIAEDGFITQMRTLADRNRRLEKVTFSQRWSAGTVRFAARTDNGGALVFATLERLDSYDLEPGVTVSFPAGSPQQSLLGAPLSSSGTLRYYHQVLLFVPRRDGGKPRALGQYGGVVGLAAPAGQSASGASR